MRKLYKLTEEEFSWITEHCDAVLAEAKGDKSILGIAWLHVLNSHIVNQSKYGNVFYPVTFSERLIRFMRRFIRVAGDLILSVPVFPVYPSVKRPEKAVLFISHRINPALPRIEPDFYFKGLPALLKKNGYYPVIALLNHTRDNRRWLAENDSDGITRVLIPRRMDFLSEIKIFSTSLYAYIRFRSRADRENEIRTKRFFRELARQAFSEDTMRAFRVENYMRGLQKKIRAKTLTLTWEGHSWERMAAASVRDVMPVFVSGYQHTILYPGVHALRRSLGSTYDPDVLLTVGSITSALVKQSGAGKIIEYGSPRISGEEKINIPDQLPNACLVAPEGLIPDNILLFGFAVKAAMLLPETLFIFRTYPGILFSDIQKMDDSLQNLPDNILISDYKNMYDDFARTRWILYRTTSVSLFAMRCGLRPLHLTQANEPVLDPLWMMDRWRFTVQSPAEFAKIIEKDLEQPGTLLAADREYAQQFSASYMKPVQYEVFEQLIAPLYT
jgi:hypothetical protein